MIKFILILIIYIIFLAYSLPVKKYLLSAQENRIYSTDLGYGFIFLIIISFLSNMLIPLKFLLLPVLFVGFFLILKNFPIYKKHFQKELFLIIISIAFFIQINPLAGDTPFYHLQLIKWYSNYNMVFGISNLENRFGIISGWHHLVSIFNHEFYNFNFLYFINSIPLIVLIKLTYEESLTRINTVHQIFILSVTSFLLIYSIIHPSYNGTIFNSVGSADADSPGMYFYILSFYFFLKCLDSKKENDLAANIIFATLAYVSKLSYLPIVFLSIYLVFYLKINLFKHIKFITFLIILNILWIFKFLVSTGCFIFPIDFTCFNFDWSMAQETVKGFASETSAFARSKNNLQENYTNYDYYLNSYEWFLPWFKNFFIKIAFIKISIIIIFLSFLIFIFNFNKFQIRQRKLQIFFIVFFFMISFFYWLIAPDIRFGYALFICFTLLTVSIILNLFKSKINELNISKSIVISTFLVIICIKNFKYQFDDNLYVLNRTFDYSNLYFYRNIGDFQIYKTSYGDCAFFEKICIYSDLENLKITKKNNYLFITK